MPTCRECGGHVTDDYARVLEPQSVAETDTVRACPNCTMVRDGAEVRRARARGDDREGELAAGEDS